MSEKLHEGDIVRVRGLDGPWMTITNVAGAMATCAWFDRANECREHRFPWTVLEKRDAREDQPAAFDRGELEDDFGAGGSGSRGFG